MFEQPQQQQRLINSLQDDICIRMKGTAKWEETQYERKINNTYCNIG